MAKYKFRLLMDYTDGTKEMYVANKAGIVSNGFSNFYFIDTDSDTAYEASTVLDTIENMMGADYTNDATFTGSIGSGVSSAASDKFIQDSSTKPLSASLNGDASTGTIVLTANSNLKRYKFFGEKVCSVLGFPENIWIYPENVVISNTGSEETRIRGNLQTNALTVTNTFNVSNIGSISSDLPFRIDKESDRWLKFINTVSTAGFNENNILFGYNNTNDTYELKHNTVVDDATACKFHISASKLYIPTNIDNSSNADAIELDGYKPSMLFKQTNADFLRIGSLVSDTSDPDWMIAWHDDDDLRFGCLSTTTDTSLEEKMVIFSDGGVGIPGAGTTMTAITASTLLHLQSTDDARIVLEADTDNSGEDGNAEVWFSQDGGLVEGAVGFKHNTNYLQLLTTWDNADSRILLRPASTITLNTTKNGTTFLNTPPTTQNSAQTPIITIGDNNYSLGNSTGNFLHPLRLQTDVANSCYLDFYSLRNNQYDNDDWQSVSNRIQCKIDSSWMGWIGFNGGVYDDDSGHSDYGITFGTGNSTTSPGLVPEVMRIDRYGHVAIGTTNTSYGNTFRVEGSAGSGTAIAWIRHTGTTDGNNNDVLVLQTMVADGAADSSERFLNFVDAGATYIGKIRGNGSNVQYVTSFTGQHASVMASGSYEAGMIVESTGEVWGKKNDGTHIDTGLPKVQITTTSSSKKVYGVLAELDASETYEGCIKAFGVLSDETPVTINSIGEGLMIITNINGNVENGDYIVSSDISGYGQKQDDDLLRSSTVAKCTETIDWGNVTDTITHNGVQYKKYTTTCTYHCG